MYIVVAGTIDLFVVEKRLTLRKVSSVLRHDITEILLKVALNTIKQTNQKVVSTIPSN
jgi:hypothetical protein